MNIKENWKKLHPVFIAIFPVLGYYASNSSEALLSSTWVPLFLSLVLMGVVWSLLQLILRDIYKSALLTSIFLVAFFSYQHVANGLKELRNIAPFIPEKFNTGTLAVYIVVAAVLLLLSLRLKDTKKIAGFFTILGLYLVVSSIVRIVPAEISRAQTAVDLSKLRDERVVRTLDRSLNNASTNPDIYYIIPDRHARQDVLKKYYKYDNSKFIDFLEGKGFFVASKSRANYPKTFLSLASSLNLQHITNLSELIGRDVSDNTPVFEMVHNNLVSEYLKNRGYKFIYFGSWWEPTRVNPQADRNINLYASSNEFLRKFGQTTVLNPIFFHVFKAGDILGFSDERVRENHKFQFEQLKKIAESPSPKFVFVHLLAPHSPYVFDADCNAFTTKSNNRSNEEYVAQLECIDNQLMQVIDAILDKSDRLPIILLQSDEGPFKVDEMNKHGEGVDWTKVSDDAARQHMGILNAYYLPDFDKSKLYPSITPVNSFRLIFNNYFGTHFTKLEDKSYFIPHLNRPYDFYEVTDIL